MASTPKGAATRRKIVEAAWALSDARGAEAILAGVTLREIATAADMTPSAVTYHFPTMQSLGLAMVEHLADSVSMTPIEIVDQLLDRVLDEGVAAVVRAGAQANWNILTEPAEVDVERRLTRCYSAIGDNPDSEAIKRLIASTTAVWIAEAQHVYERTAARMGLRLVEPFTFEDLARAAAAVSEGLLYQWMCDPRAVRPELAADVLVALVSATLARAPSSVTLEERAADLPRPPAAELTDDGDAAAAAAVASLFAEGVAEVTLTEVARAMGCGPEEVAERFGSVDGVAALSFVRHVGRVAEAVDRRHEVTAAVRLTDGVYELTRCVQGDPHCAIALLQERHRSAIQPTTGSSGRAVGASVSFATALLPPLRALVDRPDADVVELAELIVDTSLGHGATHPRTPPGAITDVVLRLVPVDL
jgi:AcrR family transcriptional regulator